MKTDTHQSDENGNTEYECAFIKLPPGFLNKRPGSSFAFAVTSDPQYGSSTGSDSNTRSTLAEIGNVETGATSLPGGSTLSIPLYGVLVAGDLTQNDSQDNLDKFISIWTANTLGLSIFEGYGNHDFGNQVGPQARGAASVTMRNGSRDVYYIDNNNTLQTTHETITSADGHYSWDWDEVHFVNLNEHAGGIDPTSTTGEQILGMRYEQARDSLKFLEEDLEQNVGTTGRPVVLMQHFGFDDILSSDIGK